jgi:hypothetical protein
MAFRDAARARALGRPHHGVALPHAARPFQTLLCQQIASAQDRAPKTLLDWTRQAALQIHRWLPDRSIVLVADSAFAAIEFLAAVRTHVCVVTRLRLDANLFGFPPQKRKGRGRPPTKGKRLKKLSTVLEDRKVSWQRHCVSLWYGQTNRRVEISSGAALWYRGGVAPVPIRWLLVRDPTGEFKPQAFLATDLNARPRDILAWFVSRWQVDIDQAWRLSRLCCRLWCGSGGAAGGSRRQAAPGRRGRANFLQRGERLGIHAHEQDAVRGVLHAAAG